MSIGKMNIQGLSSRQISSVTATRQKQAWYTFLFSPLWLCFLLAIAVRLWLIVHTHGFIDGDEAVVGIQAQHILQGERPVYYYGQPYMGSLEAYLIALLFAIAGPSVWAQRAEPLLLSLAVVGLTWRLAGALAEEAQLSPSAKKWFVTIAGLLAAIPPLYDAVIEMRAWGGHIETYVIMLSLLLSALRLTQRWKAGASLRELTLRWAVIGFLVGLGLWVYPLVVSAIIVAALWIAGYCIVAIIKASKRTPVGSQGSSQSVIAILKRLALALVAIPASLIGFAPAIYWGASHQWANITYLLLPNNGDSQNPALLQRYPTHLALLRAVVYRYTTCIAPHIIGGGLPTTSATSLNAYLLIPSTLVSTLCALTTLALVTISPFRRHPSLVRIQRLAALPTLFGVCTALLFCFSNISTAGLLFPCSRDEVGRYAAPLLLVLPFAFATILTSIILYQQERREQQTSPRQHPTEGNSTSDTRTIQGNIRLRMSWPIRGLLIILALYLCSQVYTYLQTDGAVIFQSFACTIAPVNNEPIIAYLQQEHIHYAWAPMWIGNSIVFKTNSSIIIADPRIITVNASNHIPANTTAVSHANHASVLAFIGNPVDPHPDLLKTLDAQHVKYHSVRFPAEQGFEVLVVTPLSRTLSPFEANSLGSWSYGC